MTKACILAIGTELIEGQIVNSNAAWLSCELTRMGFIVDCHISVADDRESILYALSECEARAAFIFVCGGLGPTSDDLTRQLVAEWAGVPLTLDPESWTRLQSKLQTRGVQVTASQKQQCYFPQNATILQNDLGTADAFRLQKNQTQIWALPGPPKEIQALWIKLIQRELENIIPINERDELFTWRCIGKPESDLADLVDAAAKGSDVRVGYRLESPYVEVKAWCRHHDVVKNQVVLNKIDQTVAPYVLVRQNQDLARDFFQRLPQRPIAIHDRVSDGILHERLAPFLRTQSESEFRLTLVTDCHHKSSDPERETRDLLSGHDSKHLILSLAGFNDQGQWAAGLRRGESFTTTKLWPPVARPSLWNERGRRVVVELAFQYWIEHLP